MAKRISLFNHKGDVSKTTTAFNLGWMLAKKGKTVILVDADPQCNLTGLMLNEEKYGEFYSNAANDNLKKSLAPAFDAQPTLIKAAECYQVPNNPNLYLLAGHLELSEYEVILGMAQKLSDSSTLRTLRNLPGSFSELFKQTADKYQADYLLIDTNPSLSSINQNLLMTSDFFILPTSPDFFSKMAINSLSNILPKWASWADEASAMPMLKDAIYPFTATKPKFLGFIIQRYKLGTKEDNAPTGGFDYWVKEITEAVNNKLAKKIGNSNMLLNDCQLEELLIGKISDFNTLIALSQYYNVPIFELTEKNFKEYGYSGSPFNNMLNKVKTFKDKFSEMAETVILRTQ